MQRASSYDISFLLAALLIFAAGCAKAPEAVEQPKPVEQPAQIAPEPVEPESIQPQLPIKRGALVITSEPMGAEVHVDDKPMGTTPLALKDVPAGSYRVEMEFEHYETWRGNVDVRHQQMAEVRAELEPESVALEVKSEPSGAVVSIDGKQVGTTPYSGWISAGEEHTVFIAAEGYRFESRKVVVQPGGREVVSAVLEEAEAGEWGAATITGRDGAEMVLIPPGEFQMGSNDGNDDEKPVHTVYLDAFYIDKCEVTNAQYKKFMDATKHKAPRYWNNPEFNAPDQPVVGVSWNDAKAYCDWAGKRLPTEAEWEKAARGRLIGKKYPWGDTITHDDANYSGTDGKDRWEKTAPVGSFAPNGYGLCDMVGNVWEWCADWYDKHYYGISAKRDPAGPDSGRSRVLRGGSWRSSIDILCVAARLDYSPAGIYFSVGFRCVAQEPHK